MKIKIIAVGQKMPQWVNTAFQEYNKRLPRHLHCQLIELPIETTEKEGQRILAKIAASDHVVALEVTGQAWDTPDVAKQLQRWQQQGQDICLLIGGPDGLTKACRTRAQQQWSLSKLTLPHPLVRIVLIEQLYRAWTLLNNHPYHRA